MAGGMRSCLRVIVEVERTWTDVKVREQSIQRGLVGVQVDGSMMNGVIARSANDIEGNLSLGGWDGY